MDKLQMAQDDLDRCLFEACHNGHLNYARTALAAGASVNARNTAGKTPLHSAAWSGKAEMVRLLIDAGADINAKDGLEQTPLDLAPRFDAAGVASLLNNAAANPQQGHAGRITEERKDNGPPQVGG